MGNNEKWFYAKGDTPVGPFSKEELASMAKTNIINGETLVWLEGSDQWILYSQIEPNNVEEVEEIQAMDNESNQEEKLVEPEKDMSNQWYYTDNNEPNGPWSQEDVIQKIKDGEVSTKSLFWNETLPEWVPIQETPMKSLVEETTVAPDKNNDKDAWYVALGDMPKGPYSEQDIIKMKENNEIDGDTSIWKEAMSDWITLKSSKLASGLKVEPTKEAVVKKVLEQREESKDWFYAINDENYGPVSRQEIIDLVQNGTLNGFSLIWKKGTPNWVEVQDTEFSNYITQSNNSEGIIGNLGAKPSKKKIIIGLLVLAMLGAGFGYYKRQQQVKLDQQIQQKEAEEAKKEQETKKAEEEAKKAEEEQKKAQEEKEKKSAEAEKQKVDSERQKKAEEEKNSLNGVYTVTGKDLDGDNLNIRSAPSVDAADIGDYGYGNKVQIIDTIQDGIYLWGKTAEGNYVCIKKGSEVYMDKIG